MRLFGKVNSRVDRFDRAEWFSCPFDMAWALPKDLVAITAYITQLLHRAGHIYQTCVETLFIHQAHETTVER